LNSNEEAQLNQLGFFYFQSFIPDKLGNSIEKCKKKEPGPAFVLQQSLRRGLAAPKNSSDKTESPWDLESIEK